MTIENGRALVRNVDPAESDVERTTLAKLREFYRLPDAGENRARKSEGSPNLAAGSERPDELWRRGRLGLADRARHRNFYCQQNLCVICDEADSPVSHSLTYDGSHADELGSQQTTNPPTQFAAIPGVRRQARAGLRRTASDSASGWGSLPGCLECSVSWSLFMLIDWMWVVPAWSRALALPARSSL